MATAKATAKAVADGLACVLGHGQQSRPGQPYGQAAGHGHFPGLASLEWPPLCLKILFAIHVDRIWLQLGLK
jgi:hypothetical protein